MGTITPIYIFTSSPNTDSTSLRLLLSRPLFTVWVMVVELFHTGRKGSHSLPSWDRFLLVLKELPPTRLSALQRSILRARQSCPRCAQNFA